MTAKHELLIYRLIEKDQQFEIDYEYKTATDSATHHAPSTSNQQTEPEQVRVIES